jgi:hypothetical protein
MDIHKKGPGGAGNTPEPGPQGGNPMAKERILQSAVSNEVRRKIFREFLNLYRNELMDDEERQLLADRIKGLRRQLGLV